MPHAPRCAPSQSLSRAAQKLWHTAAGTIAGTYFLPAFPPCRTVHTPDIPSPARAAPGGSEPSKAHRAESLHIPPAAPLRFYDATLYKRHRSLQIRSAPCHGGVLYRGHDRPTPQKEAPDSYHPLSPPPPDKDARSPDASHASPLYQVQSSHEPHGRSSLFHH